MVTAQADYQTETPSPDAQSPDLIPRLQAIVGELQREADERVGKRELIESRWLSDLRQYHGKYDDKILSELRDAKKSQLFINATRPKTNAMIARLSDMLFPTDDKNWGIEPTPVPELTVEAEEAAMQAAKTRQAAVEADENDPNLPNLQQEAATAGDRSRQIQLRLDEARKRARSMESEIDDHLTEARYEIQAREVIEDACKMGTGVIKGPVIGGRSRRSWSQTTAEDGTPMFVLAQVEDKRPVYWRVDPWQFFPDMDARSMDECESVYERHLMKPKKLRALAKEPGFDPNAIRRLLMDEPRSTTPTYITNLRSITQASTDAATNHYHVWEYHGPLSVEQLRILATVVGKPDMVEDFDKEDIDPLTEVQVVVWFCQGEVLKFGIHHLDSEESIYSVFCLEKDEACIFGFGVPYLMRDSQKALAAGWRTLMDNAGLSSGPQIEVNPEVVEPANGVWALEARKIWLRRSNAPPGEQAFKTYDIPMHQAELANIIELSKRNIDDETAITTLAQGEQGTHTTQTAQGMTLLMNATNVVFRRIVKNWDDDMTVPNIRRLYDWLMQFSAKEHIKGDYQVDARGTSVLLVRELQSANLMAFLMQFSAHPTLAVFLKEGGLPALRRLTQTMMIPADELIKTNEELAEEAAADAEAPPDADPAILEIEAKMNLAQMEWDARLELAQIDRETEMMKLAAQHNMTLDELEARLEIKRIETGSKERLFTSEAAMEERNAARGVQQGSGGYLSAGAGGSNDV